MWFWEFWRKRKECRQNPAEDSIIDTEKTEQAEQNSGIKEHILVQTQEDKEQDEAFYFDRERHKPVIRSSICTGEQVAGFKDRRTGRFMEIMLIRDNGDIEAFTHKYGISREEITKEW